MFCSDVLIDYNAMTKGYLHLSQKYHALLSFNKLSCNIWSLPKFFWHLTKRDILASCQPKVTAAGNFASYSILFAAFFMEWSSPIHLSWLLINTSLVFTAYKFHLLSCLLLQHILTGLSCKHTFCWQCFFK